MSPAHNETQSDDITLKYSLGAQKNKRMKQQFGKAKLFEVRRLVRRIRQFENKKGTAEQLQKNKRKVSRMEEQLQITKDARLDAVIAYVDERSGSQDGVSKQNINAREIVFEKLASALELNKELLPTDETAATDSKNDNQRNISQTKQAQEKTKSPFSAAHGRDKDHKRKRRMKVTGGSSDEVLQRSSESVFVSSMKELSNVVGNKKPREESEPLDFSDSESEKTMKKLVKSKKQKSFKVIKKNRTGQRSRQKMWEQMYGMKAKHRMKNRESNPSNSKFGSDKLSKKLKQKQEEKTTDQTLLHPSWEAKKNKKESIVEFAGKKITFDF
ncbi:protein bud22 [Nematostella vectensis]|uniref:protein bud22 n=1 Tax=Nematostella vectensis TaxID=45351 RepID=UPI0020770726|nr:protein bud22 [Nematostella vectensis]